MRKHFHMRIADFLAKHKSKDELIIAKHYLAAQLSNKAVPFLLRVAHSKFENGEDDNKELIFLALWASEDDESRYEALVLLEKYAERHSIKELQSTVLDQLKEMGWKMQNDQIIANIMLRKARFLMRAGEIETAIKLSLEAKEIGIRINSKEIVLRSDNNLGALYFYTGRLQKAEAILTNVVKLADGDERVKAFNNLAAIAGVKGDFEMSYRYFAKTLTLAREMKNLDYISACLNNLANTAEKLADYNVAEKHYRETLSLIDRTKNPKVEILTLNNLVVIHRKRGSLGLAWNTATEAYDFAKEHGDLRGMAVAKSQQMEVARMVGDTDLAIAFSRSFGEICQGLNDKRLVLVANWNKLFLEQLKNAVFDKELEKLSEDLCQQNIHDVATWALLQIALSSKDVGQCTRLIKRVTKLPINRHQRFLIKIIKQRRTLLANKDKALVVDGLEPIPSQEYAENAQALSLLSQVYKNIDSHKANNYKHLAKELLKTQAQGLPINLKDYHLRQLGNWIL